MVELVVCLIAELMQCWRCISHKVSVRSRFVCRWYDAGLKDTCRKSVFQKLFSSMTSVRSSRRTQTSGGGVTMNGGGARAGARSWAREECGGAYSPCSRAFLMKRTGVLYHLVALESAAELHPRCMNASFSGIS